MQPPRRLKHALRGGLGFYLSSFFLGGKRGGGERGFYFIFWVLGVFPMYSHQVPKGFPNCSLKMFPTLPNN
jgi:hypothetical protein